MRETFKFLKTVLFGGVNHSRLSMGFKKYFHKNSSFWDYLYKFFKTPDICLPQKTTFLGRKDIWEIKWRHKIQKAFAHDV